MKFCLGPVALRSLALLSCGHFFIDLYSNALGALQPLLVARHSMSLARAGFLGGGTGRDHGDSLDVDLAVKIEIKVRPQSGPARGAQLVCHIAAKAARARESWQLRARR